MGKYRFQTASGRLAAAAAVTGLLAASVAVVPIVTSAGLAIQEVPQASVLAQIAQMGKIEHVVASGAQTAETDQLETAIPAPATMGDGERRIVFRAGRLPQILSDRQSGAAAVASLGSIQPNQTVPQFSMDGMAGFGAAMDGLFQATEEERHRLAELTCMTEALYFEARGETENGQRAVAEVILNRVASPKYPDTVCEVVNQGAKRRHACQFSFMCDGKPESMDDRRAFRRAQAIARSALADVPGDLTDGATHYHTVEVSPDWSAKLTRTVQIGFHVFYRQPDRIARN
jgi:spore germination cell wall hydrolase CwlJ-like protein